MKLHQIEWCHNCAQEVKFEFEDIADMRQVITCPVCGHLHYRELDEGTLLNIRLDHMRPGMKVVSIHPIPMSFSSESISLDLPIQTDAREVLGVTEEGIIVEKKPGDSSPGRIVTQRRWGTDPRQRLP